jgi:hypothetical protein
MDGSMHGWGDSRVGTEGKAVNFKTLGFLQLGNNKSFQKRNRIPGYESGIRLG